MKKKMKQNPRYAEQVFGFASKGTLPTVDALDGLGSLSKSLDKKREAARKLRGFHLAPRTYVSTGNATTGTTTQPSTLAKVKSKMGWRGKAHRH